VSWTDVCEEFISFDSCEPLTKYIQNSVQVLDYSLVPSSRPHPAQEKCDGAADPVG